MHVGLWAITTKRMNLTPELGTSLNILMAQVKHTWEKKGERQKQEMGKKNDFCLVQSCRWFRNKKIHENSKT